MDQVHELIGFFHELLLIAVAVVALYFAVSLAIGYAKATGTRWERLLAAANGSLTKLWSQAAIVLAGGLSFLPDLADTFLDPGVIEPVKAWLGSSPTTAVAIAIVANLARNRSLKKVGG